MILSYIHHQLTLVLAPADTAEAPLGAPAALAGRVSGGRLELALVKTGWLPWVWARFTIFTIGKPEENNGKMTVSWESVGLHGFYLLVNITKHNGNSPCFMGTFTING